MEERDTYMYYRPEVDPVTNYRPLNTANIKQDIESRLPETSSNDNERYHLVTNNTNECKTENIHGNVNPEYKRENCRPEGVGITPVKKGRGRPKKVCDGIEIKEWSDDEIRKLIEVWGTYDILYNCKHPLYHNKAEKANAMESLRETLEDAGIVVSTRQIFDKLTTLRNYYGAVKRKAESLKRQGFEGDENYGCRWQFYQPLSFLEGTFTPRHSDVHLKKHSYMMDPSQLPTQVPKSERHMPSLLTVSNQPVRTTLRESFDRTKEPLHFTQSIPPSIYTYVNQPLQAIQSSHANHVNHINQSNYTSQPNHVSQPNHINQANHPSLSILTSPPNHPSSPIHANQPNHPSPSVHINHANHPSLSIHANQPNHLNHANHSNQPSPSPQSHHDNPPSNHSIQSSHTINNNNNNNNQPSHTKHSHAIEISEDQLFGEMVAKMICGIPDSEEKALLLIRMQQDIVQTKFRAKSAFQKPRNQSTPWNNNHVTNNAPIREPNTYYPEQKPCRSLEHSPLSSRSDSPLSSPACPPKLDMTS